jgi:hypothetical protein
MKIDYQYSGGFFYLELEYHQDTRELLPEVAQEICHLVESAQVFEIDPEKIAPTPQSLPDITLYQVSLADGSRQISFECDDVTAPVALRPLLARLRGLALDSRNIQ